MGRPCQCCFSCNERVTNIRDYTGYEEDTYITSFKVDKKIDSFSLLACRVFTDKYGPNPSYVNDINKIEYIFRLGSHEGTESLRLILDKEDKTLTAYYNNIQKELNYDFSGSPGFFFVFRDSGILINESGSITTDVNNLNNYFYEEDDIFRKTYVGNLYLNHILNNCYLEIKLYTDQPNEILESYINIITSNIYNYNTKKGKDCLDPKACNSNGVNWMTPMWDFKDNSSYRNVERVTESRQSYYSDYGVPDIVLYGETQRWYGCGSNIKSHVKADTEQHYESYDISDVFNLLYFSSSATYTGSHTYDYSISTNNSSVDLYSFAEDVNFFINDLGDYREINLEVVYLASIIPEPETDRLTMPGPSSIFFGTDQILIQSPVFILNRFGQTYVGGNTFPLGVYPHPFSPPSLLYNYVFRSDVFNVLYDYIVISYKKVVEKWSGEPPTITFLESDISGPVRLRDTNGDYTEIFNINGLHVLREYSVDNVLNSTGKIRNSSGTTNLDDYEFLGSSPEFILSIDSNPLSLSNFSFTLEPSSYLDQPNE